MGKTTIRSKGQKAFTITKCNAKEYGIPQNRNRCFMVSLHGDYYFHFPKPMPLKVRLKDFLDKQVDEKYYLSDKTIEMFIEHTAKQQEKGNGFKFEPTNGGGTPSVLAQGQVAERTTILFAKAELPPPTRNKC